MELARRLRTTPTVTEMTLWRLIHPLRTSGHHFRKQAPIGPYVVDFVCHAARLMIEVDGDRTTAMPELPRINNETRFLPQDAFLAANGYRVLRFTNADVLTNAEGVFWAIEQAPQPTPS